MTDRTEFNLDAVYSAAVRKMAWLNTDMAEKGFDREGPPTEDEVDRWRDELNTIGHWLMKAIQELRDEGRN